VSPLVLEQIPLQRFLAMNVDDLRGILDELPSSRNRHQSPLDRVAIESLVRVIDRAGYKRVSALGPGAATAWATRVGVS
jgi:hypothetical protein